jgi:tripartite-type tricarboxylate transporter receptor subunit TctC
MFDNTPNVLPHVKAGQAQGTRRVVGRTRSPFAPEVPTVDEAGVPGYEVGVWFGVLTVAGTPPDIVRRLNTEMVKILTSPRCRQRITNSGVDVGRGLRRSSSAPSSSPRWRAGPR